MKKILFLTFAFMTAVLSCSKPDDNIGGGTGTKPGGNNEEVAKATISLSLPSINLGGSMFDTSEVTVSTNQSKITLVCDQTWMTAKMNGRILEIISSEANETGVPRTGTITITAGEGENTASATLTVIQGLRDASSEVPVIQISSESETLASASGSTAVITYSTNQPEVTVSFSGTQNWLSYEMADGKVTFTALSANTTGNIRSVDVTFTAGTATATCTVRQISDAPTGIAIGALYEGGMIFEIAADYVKIMSLSEGNTFWASDATKESHMGTDANPTDGVDNTAVLAGYSNFTGNFPAAEWCISQGEGWYLPARAEFNTMIDNLKLKTLDGQELINKFLETYGGAPLTFGTQYYWSSCERENDGTKVYCVRLNDKAHGYYNKKGESGRPVRAVKKIAVDVAGEMDKIGGGLGDFNITEETWTNN